MKCTKCGYENEYGKEYCASCGEGLKKTTIRSNNGFKEVDLEVIQGEQNPPVVEERKEEQKEAPEEPILLQPNIIETPPAIGQIPKTEPQQVVQPVTPPPQTEIKEPTQPNQTISQQSKPVGQQPLPTENHEETQILESMHKKNVMNWKDKGLLAILGCGVLAFAVIGTLITMSITSVNSPSKSKQTPKYREIQGEWIDNSKKNLIIISNNNYTWYQDYSNDKSNLTTGEMKVLIGSKALDYLNITEENAKQLLNITEDYNIKNFYSLKMFTSKEDHDHAYYKMLFYVKEDGVISYNFNDKQLYFLYKKD